MRKVGKMKRFSFMLLYLLSPAIPVILFLVANGGNLDSYSVSVAFGVYAFVLLCNQLILASRPGFAVSALSLKGLLALHGSAPFFILAIAATHRLLKEANGFPDDTVQATMGAAALVLFLAVSIVAFLLMANVKPPIGNKLRELRTWVEKSFRIGYKVSRAFHSITIVLLLVLAVHISLASSSALAINPLGTAYLAAWLLLSIVLYARYRVRGRPTPTISSRKPG
jgi:predicted ferric reductase